MTCRACRGRYGRPFRLAASVLVLASVARAQEVAAPAPAASASAPSSPAPDEPPPAPPGAGDSAPEAPDGSQPAAVPPPPPAYGPGEASPAVEPGPVEGAVPPPATYQVNEPPPPPPAPPASTSDRRGWYVRFSIDALAYGRGAEFTRDDETQVRQDNAGGGYGAWLMVGGSPSSNFALGGSVMIEHVPSVTVELDGEEVDSRVDSVLSVSAGPSVDYFPASVFHVGGLMGLAGERVPSFDTSNSKASGVLGIAMAIWAGFDWEVATDTSVGVLLKARVSTLSRDMAAAENGQTEESSLSLGLGASVVYF